MTADEAVLVYWSLFFLSLGLTLALVKIARLQRELVVLKDIDARLARLHEKIVRWLNENPDNNADWWKGSGDDDPAPV
jgi:hypothetical protein